MDVVIIFILGLFIGSFLNVLADRIPRNEGVVTGRSHCDECNHPLYPFDLIPFFSFLLLGGKCRYCKTKLSLYYPGSELLCAGLFVMTYLVIGIAFPLHLLFSLFIVSCLDVIFLSDMKSGIIPDKIVYPAIVVTVLFQISVHGITFYEYLIPAFAAFIFFLALFLLTRGKGMGFGDVKFSFLMGLLLGFPSIIYALYIAFLTGAIVSFILLLWKRKNIKSTIPFGPFLVLGTVLTFFFPQVINLLVSMVLP